MTSSQFIHFLVALLAVTNPLGNLAIFLGLTSTNTPKEQKRIALKTSLSIVIILLITVWLGTGILTFFGIHLPAFELAGGLVIILLGLSMLRPHSQASQKTSAKDKESIAVVPLAIPIIAGPGAITAIIVATKNLPGILDRVYFSLGCVLVSLLIYLVLHFSSFISRLLGEEGIKIATRIMGLLLVAIAMEIIISGITTLLPAFK